MGFIEAEAEEDDEEEEEDSWGELDDEERSNIVDMQDAMRKSTRSTRRKKPLDSWKGMMGRVRTTLIGSLHRR